MKLIEVNRKNPLELLSTLKGFLAKEERIVITTPTPFANKILAIGSKFRIFSREAFEEHKVMLKRDDFVRMAEKVELMLEHYERFELGLNQLVVYKKL